jgi:hypothetical protein
MDNLLAAICTSNDEKQSMEGRLTANVLIQRRFHNRNNVAGLLRNDWPECSGLAGRFAAESVAGLLRITH